MFDFFSLCFSKKEGAAQVLENEVEDKTVDLTGANPPILQTPSPVIYLANNLDQQDQLGYCIEHEVEVSMKNCMDIHVSQGVVMFSFFTTKKPFRFVRLSLPATVSKCLVELQKE